MNLITDNSGDELLERLIDNELTIAEQRQFLASIETNDEWRTIALALLEDRVIARAIQAGVITKTPIFSSHSNGPDNVKTLRPAIKPIRQIQGRMLLAAAALMLLSFGCGWLSSRPQADPTSLQLAAHQSFAEPLIDDASRSMVNNWPEAVDRDKDNFEAPLANEVQVMFAEGNQTTEPMVVSVIETPDFSQLKEWENTSWSDEQNLTGKLQSALDPHQWDVVKRDQWIEVNLADGRRGLMPVRDLVMVARETHE